MKRLALLALMLVPGCTPQRHPVGPPPPPPGPGLVLKGERLAVSHLVRDPDRRYAGDHLDVVTAGNAILCSWDRDRHIHLFAGRAEGVYDVAFLDASGKVLAIQGLPGDTETGVSSAIEARHALLLPPTWAKTHGLAAGDRAEFGPEIAAAKIAPMPQIKVAGKVLHVETSHRSEQRMRGLMHRPRMSADEGMLFLYRNEDEHGYWMRNTLMPLDIAYFRADGSLANVCRMKMYPNPAADEEPKAPSAGPVQYVLELNYGWFDALKLIDADGRGAVKLEIPDAVLQLSKEAD